ncbi:MAG: hypothetical protein Q6373_017915 [Candidatus Sigynarchaeota archaeon]
MALTYHNKAMDLHSLAINVNEEILAINDERRAHFVELQQKFLNDIDTALKRYSHVSFGRATMKFIPREKLVQGMSPDPAGQALIYPLKINEDSMIYTLITAGSEQLDHRRIIPSMEKIQDHLDEVRRVTLVRGINFVQQDAILQRYTNRFMQYAETDYCDARWNSVKPVQEHAEANEPGTLASASERPDWTRVATYRMPWHFDSITGAFVPVVDDFTQEIDPLSSIDDRYLVQFNIVCPALPIVPRLLEITAAHVHKLWTELSMVFVPQWKHDLVHTLIKNVMANVDVGTYSVIMTPSIIERELLDKVLEHVKGYDEYASGLEARFHDLRSQPADANIFSAMLEGFKTIVGKSPAIDRLADAIKAAQAASLNTTIAPGMESDARVAEGTLLQVKQGIAGIRTRFVQAAVDVLKQSMLKEAVANLESRLLTDALQNEKGIVKAIGTSIVKKTCQAFLRRQLDRLASSGTASNPIIDSRVFKEDYKAALRSCMAGFKIDIDQLIQLAAELLTQDQQDVIAPYLQKFLALKRDVLFLKEFLLKADVLNKFLEKHYEHFYDPKSFSKLLGDWVSEEVAQLPVEWGSLISNWFTAFSNVFQLQHAQKPFTRSTIIQKFYEFTKIVADEQNTFDNTFAIMSSFVGTLTDSRDKKALTEYLKRFEQSQSFQDKFPKYLEDKISKTLDGIKPSDLEVTLKDQAGITAAIAKRIEAGIPGMLPMDFAIPSEIVLRFEKDTKIEFKIALEAAPDGLTVNLLTNWFRLVEAY